MLYINTIIDFKIEQETHKLFNSTCSSWIIYFEPRSNLNIVLVYSKNYPAVHLRKNISIILNMPQKEITMCLKKNYHCITWGDKERYVFSNEQSAKNACDYLNGLMVARKLM